MDTSSIKDETQPTERTKISVENIQANTTSDPPALKRIDLSSYMITLQEAEEALKQHISHICVPSDILDRFKINELKYHSKLTHIEYFDNLILAAERAILDPQLIVMMVKILSTDNKVQLIPFGENYEHLSVWYMSHTITNHNVLRPLYRVANEIIKKLFASTNFDLLKSEIEDLNGCSVLSDKSTELLRECCFPPEIQPYLLPITVQVYIGRTFPETNLTTKLHKRISQIENFLIGGDLDSIYGTSIEIENNEMFMANFDRYISVSRKILASSADTLVVISWVRYFAKRFTGETKIIFLQCCIKELNRSATDNDRFNPSALRKFFNMAKNKRLIPIKQELKITEMDKDENPKTKSETGVKRKKISFESTSKNQPEKKRPNFHRNDETYIFLKRGSGIKFTKPPKVHVPPYTKFCECCGVFEKYNNKTGKFVHSFIDGKYVGKHRLQAIKLDKVMRKAGAKDEY